LAFSDVAYDAAHRGRVWLALCTSEKL
jgi:hypothetical protein